MKTRIVWLVAVLNASPPMVGAQHAATLQRPTPDAALSPHDSAFHALNRLAYGPRPGEAQGVAAGGVMRWIERQLSPDGIDDARLARREHQFQILDDDRGDLAAMYAAVQRERRQRKLADAPDTLTDTREDTPMVQRGRRLAGEFADLAVLRAALSERQVYEVMVDFWTNHFNIYFAKGADRFLTPDYIEHAIRLNAMGKFADLLIATAKSPAMLFYLDNWESVAPGTSPPGRNRGPKGINENYARELLELHTLGVDGGYSQQDVIDVARIFTGWGIARPRQGGDFEFHDWAHDRGEKHVLGVRFQAGHGMDEGIRLLRLLASHPATMHHVSRSLCQRFVNDDPPDGCVDDAVAAWKRSNGDIREVLRAIFRGPDFWAPGNLRAKVKTPLEFVVSAVRAVAAEPDTSPRLAGVVARLGEPLYLHVAPDGYAEKEDAWVNSGALLDRMNAAVSLAAGRLPGVTVDLDSLVAPAGAGQLIDAINEKILGGMMSENTRDIIRRQVSGIGDPLQARALAVGLAIGGPEFQRQ